MRSIDAPDAQTEAARPMSQVEVDAITKRLKKALVERMLGGELTHYLSYPLGGREPPEAANHRNGTSAKTVLTDEGPLTLDIPRDREGTFAPLLIGKRGGRGFRRPSRRGDARALT